MDTTSPITVYKYYNIDDLSEVIVAISQIEVNETLIIWKNLEKNLIFCNLLSTFGIENLL